MAGPQIHSAQRIITKIIIPAGTPDSVSRRISLVIINPMIANRCIIVIIFVGGRRHEHLIVAFNIRLTIEKAVFYDIAKFKLNAIKICIINIALCHQIAKSTGGNFGSA
ncbi:hypothetical protein SDC9_129004 [bioreactor metagenome]|uniref:Uncharacterized protein n=1 Tax=bioreactor metagenome TaxID=1076179 RepID=A0A645CXS8_9ZZZZ